MEELVFNFKAAFFTSSTLGFFNLFLAYVSSLVCQKLNSKNIALRFYHQQLVFSICFSKYYF